MGQGGVQVCDKRGMCDMCMILRDDGICRKVSMVYLWFVVSPYERSEQCEDGYTQGVCMGTAEE